LLFQCYSRPALKTIAEQGAGNVMVILQGGFRPPPAPGEPYLLEQAGLAVTMKAPKEPPPSGPPA
jgi:hypothetical protein